jgi:hypothetical protein
MDAIFSGAQSGGGAAVAAPRPEKVAAAVTDTL